MKILLLIFQCVAFSAAAQNFAVLLARDAGSVPSGFPTNWPVQIQPIGDVKELPPQFPPPWRYATKSKVEQWKADHAAEMAAFQATQEAAATQPKRDREAAIAQAISDLKLIRDSSGTLTAAQLSNAVRAISKALIALIEELRP